MPLTDPIEYFISEKNGVYQHALYIHNQYLYISTENEAKSIQLAELIDSDAFSKEFYDTIKSNPDYIIISEPEKAYKKFLKIRHEIENSSLKPNESFNLLKEWYFDEIAIMEREQKGELSQAPTHILEGLLIDRMDRALSFDTDWNYSEDRKFPVRRQRMTKANKAFDSWVEERKKLLANPPTMMDEPTTTTNIADKLTWTDSLAFFAYTMLQFKDNMYHKMPLTNGEPSIKKYAKQCHNSYNVINPKTGEPYEFNDYYVNQFYESKNKTGEKNKMKIRILPNDATSRVN